MKDAINACDYAIENSNPSLVPDTSLRITPEFRDPEFTRVAPIQKQTNDNTSSINTSNTKADPFSNQNGHTNTSGFDDDPFKSGKILFLFLKSFAILKVNFFNFRSF